MRRRTARALAATLTLGGLGLVAPPAQAAAGDSYDIIVGTGTQLQGTSDTGVHCGYSACGASVGTPFAITAYGTSYTGLWVSSNGTVQFEDSSNDQNNVALPSGTFFGPTFLPLWDRWYTGNPGDTGYGIFTRTVGAAPNRQFVIEWRVANYDVGGYYTFAQTFAEGSGVASTTYGQVPDGGGATGTVGVQNGSTASQYSVNQNDAVYTGLRITYRPIDVPSVPDAPRDPETSVLNANQSSLFWDAPADDGGSRITGYIASRNGASTSGGSGFESKLLPASARSYNFGRLLPGTTYTFSVQAVNEYGRSPKASATVTQPSTEPAAPVIGKASPGRRGGPVNALVRWGTPPFDGGSAISGYVVYGYRVVNGRDVQTVTSQVLPKVARDFTFKLPVKGQWHFRVVARNSRGASPFSAYSNTVAAR